jgi:hypothetical protein
MCCAVGCISVCLRGHFLYLLSELSLATQKISVLFSGHQKCAWNAQNCQSNYPPVHKATLIPVSDICKGAAQVGKKFECGSAKKRERTGRHRSKTHALGHVWVSGWVGVCVLQQRAQKAVQKEVQRRQSHRIGKRMTNNHGITIKHTKHNEQSPKQT